MNSKLFGYCVSCIEFVCCVTPTAQSLPNYLHNSTLSVKRNLSLLQSDAH